MNTPDANRADALREALAEIEYIIGRITHPNGRRVHHIDSLDEARVEALTSACDAIKALIDSDGDGE